MKNKKIQIILGAVIILAVIIAVLEKAHVTDFYKNPSAADVQGPTPEQKQQEAEANTDEKKQLVEPSPKDTPPPNTESNKSIDLSAQQESDNTVTVFTKLPGYTSGSCELTATNGAKVSKQTAQLIYQPEFSTCAGFSVPIDSLGKGAWTLKLAVTSNGAAETKTIAFEVK